MITPAEPKTHSFHLNLRIRFILLISSILIIIFALIAFFLIKNAHNTLLNNLNSSSKAFAQLSVTPIGNNFELYQQSGTAIINQQMQQFMSLDTNVSNIAVINVNGTSEFSFNGHPVHVDPSVASSFTAFYKTDSQGQIIQVVEPYIDSNGYHNNAVVYQVSTTQLHQTISHEELSIFIFTVLGLLVSAAATFGFVDHFFISPINEVNHRTAAISGGDYETQIVLKRHDEIGNLALSVNRMASSLKADINKMREVDTLKSEFITITSHNLRTPLATIEADVDQLKTESGNTMVQIAVSGIEKSAKRLKEFSEQMLTIANLEAGNHINLSDTLSINDLLDPLVEEFTESSKSKQISFQAGINDGETMIHANARELRAAVHNVLDNALKFTKEHGAVSLTSEIVNSQVLIKVTDNGVGIAPEELPKLFTRFHRGTETMVYDYEGTGIGLYVVKLIVEQHKGTITVESKLKHGTSFLVYLPVANPKA